MGLVRLVVPPSLLYLVVLYRAWRQAATLDEADAFNVFAGEGFATVFYPSSGNHVLNTLLAWVFTHLFGISHLTFRAGALIGAAVFLAAASYIANRLTPGGWLQWLGFAALALNPFVLDYLVASRGYALALGFLAAAFALLLQLALDEEEDEARFLRRCVMASACCGVAFSANFSFAFALIAVVAAFFGILALQRRPWRQLLRFGLALAVPGAVVVFLLVGETLAEYPRSQLYYGADSWFDTGKEMLDAVFPRENLSMHAFDLSLLFARLQPWMPLVAWVPVFIGMRCATQYREWPARFAVLALLLTVAAHTAANLWNGLLLPLDRTGLFLAFFLAVLALFGMGASEQLWMRAAATAGVAVAVVYFGLAFRTDYFRIWEFDQDTDRGFAAVVEYAKSHPLSSAGCTWRYSGAYNFYRHATHANVPVCEAVNEDNPSPHDVLLLKEPNQSGVIASEKLTVIYRGGVSGLAVCLRPASVRQGQ